MLLFDIGLWYVLVKLVDLIKMFIILLGFKFSKNVFN